MKFHNLLILSFIVALFSCNEFVQPETNQFVVEGFLTADEPLNNIKIKESVSINTDSVIDLPIADATIIISNDESETILAYNGLTGKYYDPSNNFPIEVGSSYNISIALGNVTATANTSIPDRPTGMNLERSILIVPPLRLTFLLREQITNLFDEERITLTWDAEAGKSYFVVIETQESELDPILPEGIPQESLNLLSSFRFVSAPMETTSFEIIAVALETYGKHVAKVYSVNQEYIDLFNSATQDSRDLNEPPSNINNGLGIFTGFAVDSVEFEVRRN